MMKSSLLLATLILTLGGDIVANDDLSPQPKSRTRALVSSAVPAVVLTGSGIALMAYAANNDGENDDIAGWAGFWMMNTGMILAPSFGHIYAERPKPLSGAAIRAGLGIVWMVGFVAASLNGTTTCTVDDNGIDGTALGLIIAGGGGIMASAIYDITTSGRSADRYNDRMSSYSFELSPVYMSNHDAPGLALKISF